MNQHQYLNLLISECKEIIDLLKNEILPLPSNKLLQKKGNSWNGIEVINHLLLANEFYLVQMMENLAEISGKQHTPPTDYHPGFIGKYLAKKIRPQADGKLALKSKTFKWMEPQKQSHLEGAKTTEIINDYLDQLELILNLLEKAKNADLSKHKIATALGKFFKLELGNAFDFMIAHNTRHLWQIKRATHLVD